jgi:tRNA-specific 2-thiouridylase
MVKKELKHKKIKVFVGMSGGVDSSVSAALLQSKGYDVCGVFIKVWQPDIALTGGCTWREDRLDAMRVCAKLKIPFYTLDLEKEYKKEVVDYLISEYQAGRTPNPDVMCNKYIKFGGFFDWAMKNGADYVATGHYAQTIKLKTENVKLLAGKDKNKDQSYFLWTLTQKQLSKTLFPVGDIEKPEVRKLAKKFGLPTATKKDSQGICFIGKVEMADFLKEFIPTKKGNILNEKGDIVGTHDGVYYYTLGQRHGFQITQKTANDDRYFVVGKDLKRNVLIVSHKCQGSTLTLENNEIKLKDVNWILGVPPSEEKVYQGRIRYRGALDDCQIKSLKNNKCQILFKHEQNAPASGQSIVLYDGEICLGGGIIE